MEGNHFETTHLNRRSSLQRRESSLSYYQTTTIEKHYEVNRRILKSFNEHYEQHLYQMAYFLGLQFSETALLELPKHGYYYSIRHEKDRMESALEAVRVTSILQQEIVSKVENSDKSRVARLAKLALEQVHQASEDQFENQRNRIEQQLRTEDAAASNFNTSWSVCEPLLDSVTSLMCPTSYRLPTKDSCPAEKTGIESFLDSLPEDRPESIEFEDRQPSGQSTSRASVPSLERTDSDETTLERALFLSGLEVLEEVPKHHRPSKSSTLQLGTLSSIYREDFQYMKKTQQIRISYADTYQGRLPGSTNGCTVIAPLMCIHYFLTDQLPDPGLSDQIIISVIDDETPVILGELRSRLGLPQHAFLIPSDVQDYLVSNGQLAQDQFVNVLGGNILDDSHMTTFLDTLKNCSSKKVAATFFFHEHVISILRLRREGSTFWYDCIDSLPLKDTLRPSNQSPEEFNDSLRLLTMEEELSEAIPRTARVRCLSLEGVRACLRWYACSKFTEQDIHYIDSYEWSDTQSDFDPRVFQAYVWASN